MISHTDISRRNYKLRTSVQSCLVILGADPAEVYQPRSIGINRSCCSYGKLIHQRFSKAELLDWGRNLWKQAIYNAHPDRGGNAEEAIAINRAFQTLQHICGVK